MQKIIEGKNLGHYCGNRKVFEKFSFDILPEKIVGLLHEGHVQYAFMTIKQIEKFYSKFFPNRWEKKLYYEFISRLSVLRNLVIRKLSCGQCSQVVLGLIFVQDTELLIFDDCSMGLDVGYRSLFLKIDKNRLKTDSTIVNSEDFNLYFYIFSFKEFDRVEEYLKKLAISYESMKEIQIDLESAFMGYSGRY